MEFKLKRAQKQRWKIVKKRFFKNLRLTPRDQYIVIIVSQGENRGHYGISNERKCPNTETYVAHRRMLSTVNESWSTLRQINCYR